MGFLDFPSRLDRGGCCSGPLDKAEAQLIAHEWILNKFEEPFCTAHFQRTPVCCSANQVFFFLLFFFVRTIQEPFNHWTFATDPCMFTALQTDRNGRAVWQLGTHGLQPLFCDLERWLANPQKSSPARERSHSGCLKYSLLDHSFVIAEQIRAGVGRAHTREAL